MRQVKVVPLVLLSLIIAKIGRKMKLFSTIETNVPYKKYYKHQMSITRASNQMLN